MFTSALLIPIWMPNWVCVSFVLLLSLFSFRLPLPLFCRVCVFRPLSALHYHHHHHLTPLQQHLYHASPAPSSASSLSSASSSCAASSPPILLSMSAAGTNNHSAEHNGVNGNGSASYHEGIEVSQHGYGGVPSTSSYHHHHHHHHHSPMLQSSSGQQHSLHSSQQASPHHQSQQFTTLNSALSMSNGGGLLSSGNPSMSVSSSTAITPTSVSSFFNSFGSGTGNSPPPLTPNGLLSGLQSFLFADSSTLGLDSFGDCVGSADVGCLLPPPVNSYLQLSNGQGQQSVHSMVPPSSTSPVSLTGLNSVSPVGSSSTGNANTIRLPPFCTI